jgi:hypothetical protein
LIPLWFMAVLTIAAFAMPQPVHAQTGTGTKTMSQSTTAALEPDVKAALQQYDRTKDPEALRNAADQLVREDGVVPDDPTAALQQARTRLQLWIAVFARFKRDLPADFDPANPPPWKAPAPIINGQPLPPWIEPKDLKDPAERKQAEDQLAAHDRRVQEFNRMFKLDQIHKTMVERAIDSLRNARDTLGLPAAEITGTLATAEIAPRDRTALSAGVQA